MSVPAPLVRAAAAALGLLCAGGCVVPQDDTFYDTPPPRRNRPPRIVERTVNPSTRLLTPVALPNCTLTFSVNVADPDEADLLYVYFYVDHRPGEPEADRLRVRTNVGALGEERLEAAVWGTDLRDGLTALSVPGDHVVEAIVTDTFLTDQVPQPTNRTLPLPDGGALVDPGYSDSYAWFVKTSEGSCVE